MRLHEHVEARMCIYIYVVAWLHSLKVCLCQLASSTFSIAVNGSLYRLLSWHDFIRDDINILKMTL